MIKVNHSLGIVNIEEPSELRSAEIETIYPAESD